MDVQIFKLNHPSADETEVKGHGQCDYDILPTSSLAFDLFCVCFFVRFSVRLSHLSYSISP